MGTVRISNNEGDEVLSLRIERVGDKVLLVIRTQYDEARHYDLSPEESKAIGDEFCEKAELSEEEIATKESSQ